MRSRGLTLVWWLALVVTVSPWIFTPPDHMKRNRLRKHGDGKHTGHPASTQNYSYWSEVPPLRTGKEFTYGYSAQIITGLRENSGGWSSHAHFDDETEQKAAIQLHAEVSLRVLPDGWASLRLSHMEVGVLNQQQIAAATAGFQPWTLFTAERLSNDLYHQLELPVYFHWADGVVGEVSFKEGDTAQLSNNWKKALISMLQLNLKGAESTTQPTSFTLRELSIEGDCHATYTVVSSRAAPSADHQINVTKAVQFDGCNWTADANFGFPTTVPNQCSRVHTDNVSPTTLQRSTLLHYVLKGDLQAFGIQKVQLLSDYAFSAGHNSGGNGGGLRIDLPTMHSSTMAELNFQGVADIPPEENKPATATRKDQSRGKLALNDAEWQSEKLFIGRGRPTESNATRRIVPHAEALVRSVLGEHSSPSIPSALGFNRLVALLRHFSVQELRTLHQKFPKTTGRGEENSVAMIELAMGAAATHNTLKVVCEFIERDEIPSWRAALAIGTFGTSTLYPSNEQAEILLGLCERIAAGADRGRWMVEQSCWLSAGSLVNRICSTGCDGVNETGKCSEYGKTLLGFYRNATDIKKKLLALAAIGNAGLPHVANELVGIIRTPQSNTSDEDALIRSTSIDALRRLPPLHLERIHSTVLPCLLMNHSEATVVRMAAFWRLMHYAESDGPPLTLLDQVINWLPAVEDKQLRSFIYSTLRDLVQKGEESQLREHLRSNRRLLDALKDTGVDGLSGCSTFRLGSLNLNFAMAFAEQEQAIIPSYVGLGVSPACLPSSSRQSRWGQHGFGDSLLLGQHGLVELLERKLTHHAGSDEAEESDKLPPPDVYRRVNQSEVNPELGEIRSKLGGGVRRSKHRQVPRRDNGAFAFFHLRRHDVDGLLGMLEETDLRQLLTGKGKFGSSEGSKSHDVQIAMMLADSYAYVATSIGIPLKISHSIPAMALAKGQIDFNKQSSELIVKATRLTIAMSNVHQMETVLSEMTNIGVQATHTLEANTPLEVSLRAHSPSIPHTNSGFGSRRSVGVGLKLSLRAPLGQTSQPALPLLSLHSVPATFIKEHRSSGHRHQESTTQRSRDNIPHTQLVLLDEPKIKAIHNSFQPVSDVNVRLACGFSINGHYHRPHDSYVGMVDSRYLTKLFLSTENHIRLGYENNEECRLELAVGGNMFEKVNSDQLSGTLSKDFAYFYSNWPAMHKERDRLQRRLNVRVGKINNRNQVYQHWAKIEAELGGGCVEGASSLKSEVVLKAECEDILGYCRFGVDGRVNATRQSEWSLNARASFISPEDSKRGSERGEAEAAQLGLVGRGSAQWGRRATHPYRTMPNSLESVDVRLMGDSPRRRNGNSLQTTDDGQDGFNKVHARIDWHLGEATLGSLRRYYRKRKEAYSHNLVMATPSANTTNTAVDNVAHGAELELELDPVTHRRLNVTLRSSQLDRQPRIRLESVELDKSLNLRLPSMFAGVGHNPNLKSFSDLLQLLTAKGTWAECIVDADGRMTTFAGHEYTAPLSNCYSVLAKDCSSDSTTGPRFAVLAKRTDDEEEAENRMVLKVVTQKETIEAELPARKSPRVSSADAGELPLRVKINGQRVAYNADGALERGRDGFSAIRFTNNQKSGVVIHLMNDEASVYFDGYRANIRLSPRHKHTRCGLCDHRQVRDDASEADDGALLQFHQAYTLQNNEDCTSEELRDFYSDNRNAPKTGPHRGSEEVEELTDPIEITMARELHHKLCFSTRPVAQCPEGARAMRRAGTKQETVSPSSSSSEEEMETRDFVCLMRSNINARRLLRRVSRLVRETSPANNERERKMIQKEVNELARSLDGWVVRYQSAGDNLEGALVLFIEVDRSVASTSQLRPRNVNTTHDVTREGRKNLLFTRPMMF